MKDCIHNELIQVDHAFVSNLFLVNIHKLGTLYNLPSVIYHIHLVMVIIFEQNLLSRLT